MTSAQTTAQPGTGGTTVERERNRLSIRVAGAIFAMGVVLAILLAVPGQTATTKYVNDLFIFLDGAHRIAAGQVPNVDFHSSLGPLAFYLPALGLVLTGTMAAAMPVGMATAVLGLALVAVWVIGSRMRPLVGLPLALFLLLIAAVPANPGEAVSDLSFAMFYNRLGWSALGLLLVMYLPPKTQNGTTEALDAACAAVLVLFMLYLKASYGVVGLAFLLFLLTDRRQWRRAAAAIGLTAIATVLVELAWHGTGAYVADLRLAAEVSGDVPGVRRIIDILLPNLPDLVVYAVFGTLLLLWRRNIRDFLFIGFCAATGILIIEQNFQIVGILTLGAGAAVMAEALANSEAAQQLRLSPRIARGLPLLLMTMLVPVCVANGTALGLHASLANSRTGQQVPLPNFDGIRLVRLWNEGQYANFTRYNETLREGAEVLQTLGRPARNVLVLDFVGPFSAGLDLEAPRGDSPWFHWGRTLDDEAFPAPEEVFADVGVVMEPKSPIEYWTAAGMRRVYAPYLDAHYQMVADTLFWRVYALKDAGAEALLFHSSNSSTSRQSTSPQP